MNRIGITAALVASLFSGCIPSEGQDASSKNNDETWYYSSENIENTENTESDRQQIDPSTPLPMEEEKQEENITEGNNEGTVEDLIYDPVENQNKDLIYDPVETPKQPTETSPLVGYNDKKSWWFRRNSEHIPPSAQMDINISQYDAYYLGDTQHKVIYLTFDEGYENGYTPQILDILKENDVKAAFFVTKDYIESYPELVQRMVDEGHIVGNHSVTHSDMPDLTDDEIKGELQECADYFKEFTGVDMPKYFRPPAGVYSIRSLEKTQEAGYKTIFWSFAYQDWDRNNQPGKEAAYNMVMNNYHNGSIMLLHAVSQSNTEALDDMLKSLKAEGYTFLSLDDLPKLN